MRKIPKKTFVILIVGGAVVIGTGSAYAYWSQGGAGTGTAAASTTAAITVVQTSTITNLAPGVAPQPLSGNFTNTNSGPVYVAAVTASIASVAKAVGAPVGTCDSTDYAITYTVGSSMLVGAEVPAGTAKGAWSGAAIAFNDKGVNQDACKLATVTLSYTSS